MTDPADIKRRALADAAARIRANRYRGVRGYYWGIHYARLVEAMMQEEDVNDATTNDIIRDLLTKIDKPLHDLVSQQSGSRVGELADRIHGDLHDLLFEMGKGQREEAVNEAKDTSNGAAVERVRARDLCVACSGVGLVKMHQGEEEYACRACNGTGRAPDPQAVKPEEVTRGEDDADDLPDWVVDSYLYDKLEELAKIGAEAIKCPGAFGTIYGRIEEAVALVLKHPNVCDPSGVLWKDRAERAEDAAMRSGEEYRSAVAQQATANMENVRLQAQLDQRNPTKSQAIAAVEGLRHNVAGTEEKSHWSKGYAKACDHAVAALRSLSADPALAEKDARAEALEEAFAVVDGLRGAAGRCAGQWKGEQINIDRCVEVALAKAGERIRALINKPEGGGQTGSKGRVSDPGADANSAKASAPSWRDVEEALSDALHALENDTPEDISREEAKTLTIEKVRSTLRNLPDARARLSTVSEEKSAARVAYQDFCGSGRLDLVTVILEAAALVRAKETGR